MQKPTANSGLELLIPEANGIRENISNRFPALWEGANTLCFRRFDQERLEKTKLGTWQDKIVSRMTLR